MEEAGHPPPWRHAIPERIAVAVCIAALCILILLTFAPALNHYRASDDFRLVGRIDFTSALQYFHESAGFGRNELRPMVLLTYAWDNWLWQDEPFGYHLTNLLLHLACSILLLLVLRRLTGNLLLAFVATTLFCLNPTHHSQVAWIAARDSLVCLMFLLAAWLAHLEERRAMPQNSRGLQARSTSYCNFLRATSYVAFGMALGSYEGAVAFPFILFAIGLFLGQAACWRERLREAVSKTGPFFLILFAYLAAWLLLFDASVGGYDLDWSLHNIFKDFYRMHYRLLHHIQHWLGILYLGIAWLIWRQRKTLGKFIGVSIALLWLGFLPFVAVHGYADRFGFLSSIGVALLLAVSIGSDALRRLSENRFEWRTVQPLALVLVLMGYYTNSTGRRLREWLEAGQMAESIVSEVKAMHPEFPSNASLIFDRVPTMHGNAYVFPTGFRAAVQERYRHELHIAYSDAETSSPTIAGLTDPTPNFHFRYSPEQQHLEEVH